MLRTNHEHVNHPVNIWLDADTHKESTRQTWQVSGNGWHDWRPFIAGWLDFVTQHMLDMAQVKPGSRVLDVAAGNGGQSIYVANFVGPQGSVHAIDLASDFLSLAEYRALKEGVGNMTTQVMDGECLKLEKESFDAVISRLGLMFFPNPLKGLGEMHRVLVPGGSAGCIVFAEEADNPFFSIPISIIFRRAAMQPIGLGQPGPFGLCDSAYLEDLFRQNGFRDVHSAFVSSPLRFSSSAECVSFEKAALGGIHQIMACLPADEHEETWLEIEKALSVFEGPNGFESPCKLTICVGTK